MSARRGVRDARREAAWTAPRHRGCEQEGEAPDEQQGEPYGEQQDRRLHGPVTRSRFGVTTLIPIQGREIAKWPPCRSIAGPSCSGALRVMASRAANAAGSEPQQSGAEVVGSGAAREVTATTG